MIFFANNQNQKAFSKCIIRLIVLQEKRREEDCPQRLTVENSNSQVVTMQLKVLSLEGQEAPREPPSLQIQPHGQPVTRPALPGAVRNQTSMHVQTRGARRALVKLPDQG